MCRRPFAHQTMATICKITEQSFVLSTGFQTHYKLFQDESEKLKVENDFKEVAKTETPEAPESDNKEEKEEKEGKEEHFNEDREPKNRDQTNS